MTPRGAWLLAVALVAAACGWGVYLTGSPWALLPLALPFVRVPWGDEDGEGGALPEDVDRKRREVELALGPRVPEMRRAADPPGASVDEEDEAWRTGPPFTHSLWGYRYPRGRVIVPEADISPLGGEYL